MGQALLTVDEAAARLRFHRNTVIAAIGAGQLDASKVRGRYRITEEALALFVAKGKRKGGDSASSEVA